jgi:hypothetical protein
MVFNEKSILHSGNFSEMSRNISVRVVTGYLLVDRG